MVRFNIISMLTKVAQAVLHTNMLIFETARVFLRLTLDILLVVRQCVRLNCRRVIRYIQYMSHPGMTGPWADRAGHSWNNMARRVFDRAANRPLPTGPVVDPTEVGAVAVKFHGGKRKPVINSGTAVSYTHLRAHETS